YFLRECPFYSDGEFSWQRLKEVYNGDFADNLGNLYSRVTTLLSKNFECHLKATSGREPAVIYTDVDTETTVQQVQKHIDACHYNRALEKIWRQILDPANQYAEKQAPWKLVKTDSEAAKPILYDLVESLRCAAILLKPFLPRSAEAIYASFNFP